VVAEGQLLGHLGTEAQALEAPGAIAGLHGQLPIPDGPGLGIELNQDTVDQFTVWRHEVTA
jgi:L-alanine-DL-glutamate epimerase-like enolase superfamily enzyme